MSEFDTAKMAVLELLQKNGSLDSIKAQLRSSVFLALQITPQASAKTRQENSSQDAELAVLIKDFLQTLGLAQTAAVFDAEWGQTIEQTEATRAITKADNKDTLIGSVFRSYKSGVIGNKSPTTRLELSKTLAPLSKDVLGVTKKIPPPPATLPPPSKVIADAIIPAIQTKKEDEDVAFEKTVALLELTGAEPAPSPRSGNMLALDIDVDKIPNIKTSHADTPLVKKAIDGEFEGAKERAPRQRYRSNNQATEDFYQAPASKVEATTGAKEEEDDSEQHSSDRSATKVTETSGVDYFEPVIKDL